MQPVGEHLLFRSRIVVAARHEDQEVVGIPDRIEDRSPDPLVSVRQFAALRTPSVWSVGSCGCLTHLQYRSSIALSAMLASSGDRTPRTQKVTPSSGPPLRGFDGFGPPDACCLRRPTCPANRKWSPPCPSRSVTAARRMILLYVTWDAAPMDTPDTSLRSYSKVEDRSLVGIIDTLGMLDWHPGTQDPGDTT